MSKNHFESDDKMDKIQMQKVKIESGEMETLNELEAEQSALAIFECFHEEQEGQFL